MEDKIPKEIEHLLSAAMVSNTKFTMRGMIPKILRLSEKPLGCDGIIIAMFNNYGYIPKHRGAVQSTLSNLSSSGAIKYKYANGQREYSKQGE